MIEVDISNVWGALSLTDLLEIEQEVAAAYTALVEGICPGGAARGWMELPLRNPTEETERILKAADKIRKEADACVVIGIGGSLGARGVMELLQGCDRNIGKGKGDPMLLFAGENFSTRSWNHLMELLEERDFSLIVAAGAEMELETALAFRALRWKLERKYGSDEAAGRIYVVTDPEKGELHQMAKVGRWETFALPEKVPGPFAVLTPAGLLPLAVAGIDIMALLNGAADGKEQYTLGSFENPVWLYGALRNVLQRMGMATELAASFEPSFHSFGRWWQQLFGTAGEKNLLTMPLELTTDLHYLGQTLEHAPGKFFETVVRFDPPAQQHIIGLDWRDLDRLNDLEGKPLEFVEEAAWQGILGAHGDAGVPVLVMNCGRLNTRKTGELIWFLELGCAISALVQGADFSREPVSQSCRQNLLSLLGRTAQQELPEEPAQIDG